MLLPIGLMALVENLYANALDLGVSAIVHAPIPAGSPSINNPSNNTTVPSSNVTVSGDCPIITPAVIISIYKGTTLLGSTPCTDEGTFSTTVTLGYGTHALFARVVTITGGIGNDSSIVTVTRPAPMPSPSPIPNPSPSPTATPRVSGPKVSVSLPELFPQLITKDNFAIVRPPVNNNDKGPGDTEPEGEVAWKFSIKGGTLPYIVSIDWGDGTVETFDVPTRSERTYTHIYKKLGTYIIKVKVTDAKGRESHFTTVATTQSYRSEMSGLALDSRFEATPPIVAFMQQYMFQIYIAAFSALLFLWYLEHARHFHKPVRH